MNQGEEFDEHVLSIHSKERWIRKRREVDEWEKRRKLIKKQKETVFFLNDEVDVQLFPALSLLNDMRIVTQYSCAGVSVSDDPLNHSLYAYVTVFDSESTRNFIDYLQRSMRHRLLVTYEPTRKRYDLSSFYIQHNRSFCFLLHRYAICWKSRMEW
ncbi:hypothetical protein [Aneurinibacillus aneurinilyticus]|uniref:hypothetical protein n=1 Tax=Aneurinibacillus aneurinilyticus TaxID=1391 RepID=UPI0023FA42CF|nr:hypothetical protein [Aneurinibacillus aneurinilyticus]MCI1695367.1 hypothetical protein [Aneurinibacillus aneurinilyticus]